MHAETIQVFDNMAADYDQQFTQSMTGLSQRRQTQKWLLRWLAGKEPLRILEINCGTGEDAGLLAALGHEVTATDASAEMIESARFKNRLLPRQIRFEALAFADLRARFANEKFDLIFSNFSGINCISPGEIRQLGRDLQTLLHPGGQLAFVVFGKYCWWETFYFLLKGKWKTAFRRWTRKPAEMQTGYGAVSVWYYSAKQLRKLLGPFRAVTKKPVGFFIPPSYLDNRFVNRPRAFKMLQRAEEKMARFSFMSGWADHQFILFES